MKKFFYSIPLSIILNITIGYLCYTYWSLPALIVWAFFMIFYNERASEWRKLNRNPKIH